MGAPQVAYRECITKSTEIEHTHKKQSGGSGQYAKIKVRFEPLDSGADGFEFVSDIKGGTVPKEYIPGVAKVSCARVQSARAPPLRVTAVRAALVTTPFSPPLTPPPPPLPSLLPALSARRGSSR